MKSGLTEEQLRNLFSYVLVPLFFYVSAAMNWVWLDEKEGFDFGNSIFLLGTVVLGIHWRFKCPDATSGHLYRVAVYFLPICLGLFGLVTGYFANEI